MYDQVWQKRAEQHWEQWGRSETKHVYALGDDQKRTKAYKGECIKHITYDLVWQRRAEQHWEQWGKAETKYVFLGMVGSSFYSNNEYMALWSGLK